MSNESIDLRDQLSIETPELVGIEFPLAGIGSRCIALLVDSFVQGFAFVVFLIVAVLIFSALPRPATVPHRLQPADPAKWAIALMILIPFLLQWGYFALFEAFWNGQTPGKRMLRLRVIQQSGRPIGLFESMGRNLIRIIDMLPGFYLVGAVCIFATRRQQRLGDMVAGTLVVHSVPTETSILSAEPEPSPPHLSNHRPAHAKDDSGTTRGWGGPSIARGSAIDGKLPGTPARSASRCTSEPGGEAGRPHERKNFAGSALRNQQRNVFGSPGSRPSRRRWNAFVTRRPLPENP